MQFRNVNAGDHVYFVVNTTDEIKILDVVITDVKFNKGDKHIVFENNFKTFTLDPENLWADAIQHPSKEYSVFTNLEDAQVHYDECVKEYQAPEDECLGCCEGECDCDEENCEEADDLSSFANAFEHLLDFIAYRTTGKHLDDLVKEYEESIAEDDAKKEAYKAPETVVLREEDMEPGEGLPSEKAVLAIVIKPSGLLTFDENYFDKKNPVYWNSRVYLHNVELPTLPADAKESDVDLVWQKVEEWIRKEYPELEMLNYDEDWYYTLLPNKNGISVNFTDEPIDFNIYR